MSANPIHGSSILMIYSPPKDLQIPSLSEVGFSVWIWERHRFSVYSTLAAAREKEIQPKTAGLLQAWDSQIYQTSSQATACSLGKWPGWKDWPGAQWLSAWPVLPGSHKRYWRNRFAFLKVSKLRGSGIWEWGEWLMQAKSDEWWPQGAPWCLALHNALRLHQNPEERGTPSNDWYELYYQPCGCGLIIGFSLRNTTQWGFKF